MLKCRSFGDLIMICKIRELKKSSSSLDSVFGEIAFLRAEYPDFYNWFYNKVVPGLENGSRKIFIAQTPFSFGKIDGILILKDSLDEKKICTLYVNKDARYNGFGRMFMNIAFNELNTDKPLITIASNKIKLFQILLDDYKFELCEQNPDFYSKGMSEYSVNGKLYLPKKLSYYA